MVYNFLFFKSYLEAFYKFCKDHGDVTAEIMCPILEVRRTLWLCFCQMSLHTCPYFNPVVFLSQKLSEISRSNIIWCLKGVFSWKPALCSVVEHFPKIYGTLDSISAKSDKMTINVWL